MFGLKMKKGFTLAELLIVVAIIGVLVAVAIPIFSRNLERAREATCKANRRSLYSQVIAEHILSDKPCSELFNEFVANAGKCPSGGTFSWEDSGNAGKINCDYHDGSGSSDSGSSDASPLHTTVNLNDRDSFARGAVIQDETGTCVILQGGEYAWRAYTAGTKVADLVKTYSSDAVSVNPNDIKDSSFTGTFKEGDLYYDSKTDLYYYVTGFNLGEELPLRAWVSLKK